MKPLRFIAMVILVFQCATLLAQPDPVKISWEQFKEQGQNTVTDNGDMLLCPDLSIWSQPPNDPNASWTAYTSDASMGLIVYDNFSGLIGPINEVRFWGINASYDPSIGFIVCDSEDPMTFNIRFLYDNGGSPGNSYADIYTASYRENTGVSYAGFPLYKYTIHLGLPIELTSGWIYIQGYSVGDPDCKFLWMDSPVGDNISFQVDPLGLINPLGNDLSICFGTSAEIPLSNWAIFIGIVLVLATVIIRFRRMV